MRLLQGQWNPTGLTPPEIIQQRGSGMWYCKSGGLGRGIEGSAVYRMAGHVPHDKVQFKWKTRYFGPNVYGGTATREGYTVNAKGGEGSDPVVIFVFGKADEGSTT